MAIFLSKATASYRDFDSDSATDPTLVFPSSWDYPNEYHPEYFEIKRDSKNYFLAESKFIADRFSQPDSVTISEVKNVGPGDPDGTLVRNISTSSYYGTIVLDGVFFLALSGTGGSVSLYGTVVDDSFRFPAALDTGAINVADYESGKFTNGNDRWRGDAGANNADLLDGDDIAFGLNGADMIVGNKGDDKISGGSGADQIFGGNGRDNLSGGRGRDLIDPGAGVDAVSGGEGADTFIFKNDYGRTVISDFDATNNSENIDLSAVSSIRNFRDLTAHHMNAVGNNVVIDDGNGTKIILLDTQLPDLGNADFLF